ncbi:MAG: DNA helicase RecQ [Saprospiraceae bacterium]
MNLIEARSALKKYFGYDQFRPMQAEIIERVYRGKDALVLMPTGGGKSVCFQIPALTMEGACVVVSPLIALMKDQVEGLRANGVRAAFLNSSLDGGEARQTEDDFFSGRIDLLYVSPEKVVSQSFLPLLQRAKISLFAIDEAHCISAWGHDFRPEYAQLRFLKQQFPAIPMIALTATADKVTRRDIIEQLALQEPETFIASFDRPNISLEVRPGQKRIEQIINFIKQRPGQSGIVYCLSRKSTEELAVKLMGKGIRAACYHAGMSDSDRSRIQDDFINDKTPVICATVAFGMGIDKSNVRWVIHYNLPKNIESYYQEIGRAGRDGAKADALLFYSYNDVAVLQDIISKNESENTEIQLAKLDRMKQYAEALACRRRILLSYFSEDLSQNCGNCDVCSNPPQFFDGTVIAQKALSAVYRMREESGIGLLIDVLRGSGKREIFEKGYQDLKTYGAGRDIGYGEWQHYLHQLINLGYIELAPDRHHVACLTPASHRVLFDSEKVALVRMATVRERMEAEQVKVKVTKERQRSRGELFEELRQLRLRLSQKQGIPPYLVFSDATLEEMAAQVPRDEWDMQDISGVGEKKMQQFGVEFLKAINDYARRTGMPEKPAVVRIPPPVKTPKPKSPTTLQVTLEFFQEGANPELIARERNVSVNTIYDHLLQLLEAGEDIPIRKVATTAEIQQVKSSLKGLEGPPYRLKPIHDACGGAIRYEVIKMILAHLEEKKAQE